MSLVLMIALYHSPPLALTRDFHRQSEQVDESPRRGHVVTFHRKTRQLRIVERMRRRAEINMRLGNQPRSTPMKRPVLAHEPHNSLETFACGERENYGPRS